MDYLKIKQFWEVEGFKGVFEYLGCSDTKWPGSRFGLVFEQENLPPGIGWLPFEDRLCHCHVDLESRTRADGCCLSLAKVRGKPNYGSKGDVVVQFRRIDGCADGWLTLAVQCCGVWGWFFLWWFGGILVSSFLLTFCKPLLNTGERKSQSWCYLCSCFPKAAW